jgi:hypothetical protein
MPLDRRIGSRSGHRRTMMRADPTGWVTLGSESGASSDDIVLELVAGDVARVPTGPAPPEAFPGVGCRHFQVGSAVRTRSFVRCHFYALERPTTVQDKEENANACSSNVKIPSRGKPKVYDVRVRWCCCVCRLLLWQSKTVTLFADGACHRTETSMGDKSPKSKQKDKNQKDAAKSKTDQNKRQVTASAAPKDKKK